MNWDLFWNVLALTIWLVLVIIWLFRLLMIEHSGSSYGRGYSFAWLMLSMVMVAFDVTRIFS